MPTTTICLWFDHGLAEQAAAFYTAIFPNSTVGATGHYGPDQPGPEGAVMTVEFTLDGQRYLGLNGGPQFPHTEAISLQVHVDGQAEVDHYWTRLTDGGEEGPCGWLKDRFGVSWQITPTSVLQLLQDPDRARSQRAFQAVLGMKKIDVSAVEAAAG